MNTVLIIGAGESEADVNYPALPDSLDTFGMNLMYRKYPSMNWWPTYWGCFDYRVTQCQAAGYKAMIENPQCRTKRFYLLRRVSNSPSLTVLKLHGKVGDFSMRLTQFGYGGNTGVNCAQVAACLGYQKIILIGIDGYKTDAVPGAVKDGKYLRMTMTPQHNPNYSRDNYQQKGDVFNVPGEAKFHRPAWAAFAEFAKRHGIEVLNCSHGDVADCFPRATLKEVLGGRV